MIDVRQPGITVASLCLYVCRTTKRLMLNSKVHLSTLSVDKTFQSHRVCFCKIESTLICVIVACSL